MLKSILPRRLLFLALVLAFSFSVAKADPTVVTSGFAAVTGGVGIAHFTISASDPNFSIGGSTGYIPFAAAPCSPCGASLTPSASFNSLVGYDWSSGVVQFNGQFRRLTDFETRSGLFFNGESVLLPTSGPDELLSYVLGFNGGGYVSVLGFNTPSFNVSFSGSGLATIQIRRDAGQYSLVSANYVFSAPATPNPEPTTMILLGSGLVGLIFKRRVKFLNNLPFSKNYGISECGNSIGIPNC